MVIDAGLILEGGGTRCVFTAGILDYFMEQGVYFKNVYALSASAYVALNYLSKQPGRTKKTIIDKVSSEMFSWRSLFRTGSIYNTELLFDTLPNGTEMPFDYDTFFKSEQKITFSVTAVKTGKPIYFSEFKDGQDLMDRCHASNAFPVLSRICYVDGEPVLDGGMADAIPVRKALSDGSKKNIVILTQPHGFRKKLKKHDFMVEVGYAKYPNFVKMVLNRPERYNSELCYIDELAEKGEILAYYPEMVPPGLITRKKDLLNTFYKHGYERAKEMLPQILEYVGSNPRA